MTGGKGEAAAKRLASSAEADASGKAFIGTELSAREQGSFVRVRSSRQPVRSPRLARAGAVLVVLLIVAGVFYVVKTKHVPLIPEPTSCTAVAGSQEVPLTVSQAGIAATIAGVAARQDLPTRAVTIAYAAALQESKMANLDYGDRDSLGVFQQRPSMGWGTPQQIMNPVYATGRFFAALVAVPGYLRMPIYQAAQAVQRSADGYAYDQYATVGAQLATAFYGIQPHALFCYYDSPTGKPQLAAAASALTSAFGNLRSDRVGDPAMAIAVRRARVGWAVAAWLISHAASYGISSVRYLGYEWSATKASGDWVRERAGTGRSSLSAVQAPAPATTVVFG
jgi:hypothetical protein